MRRTANPRKETVFVKTLELFWVYAVLRSRGLGKFPSDEGHKNFMGVGVVAIRDGGASQCLIISQRKWAQP